jgi:hypothetical protein
MTDYTPTAEDVDEAIMQAINTAVAFECSTKLNPTEHARLKLALRERSPEVDELVDLCMEAMVETLAEVVAALLNNIALEPVDE